MKKTYQTPGVNVSLAQVVQMLATSFDKNESGADNDVVLVKENKSDTWNDIWD